MYKHVAFIILFAILISGCQTGPSALDEAATMVVETVSARPLTATPTPVSTPLPADTPIPLPTAEPIIALTTTVEAASVLSELDVHVGTNSGIPYQDGYLAWRQNEPVTINMTGPQKDAGILQAIAENVDPANFIFKSKVTWNATGILICGLAFRGEPDLNKGKQYQFYFYRLSGLPAYYIDVYEFGRFKNTISGEKYSDGINADNDASNEFVLIAHNDQFTVSINGKQQGDFYDTSNQRKDGFLAFLAWQDSGKGSCTFEDSWLWIIP
ncbi:MAG TPA: hypothetical protein VJ987_09670 [Anaerolineales bacterium]|nr:hypothetical protein [Anaerolineales bacterium]